MNTLKAFIFHGTGGSPDVCWYRWLQKRLEDRSYIVEVPHYPELNVEAIDTFLPMILDNHVIDSDTVLIGHSGGAALLLSVLEHTNARVRQAILVAGYSTPPNERSEPVLQESYDWKKIRSHVQDIYFINSINDPYGCDDRQGRAMFNQLGGTQIILDEGHFGDYNQLFPTFELLDKLIDNSLLNA